MTTDIEILEETNLFASKDDKADTVSEGEAKKKEAVDYHQLASDYLMDLAKHEKKNIRYYQGRVLKYDGKKYLIEDELAHDVRAWCARRKIKANNNMIGNIIPWIQTLTWIKAQDHPELPFWTGKAPCKTKNVIAFNNGLLDVDKAIAGQHGLMPHTYNWVSLGCLPHYYLPEAECPTWIKFLEEALEGDEERIALLQEFYGYCLTPDNDYQKMLILKGVSRGGKGTAVKVLEAMLGADNMTGYTLTSLADKFGLGGLVGRLVASVGEVNLQQHPLKYQIFERLNNIVGQDPVEVEYKHNPIKMSLRLPVKFVVACNQMPVFADDSGAFVERLCVVDFERACPPGQRDPLLADKLIAEISGITNWAIKGLARLRAKGVFSVPAKSSETVNVVRRANSPTLAYAQDRLIVHESLDTGNLPSVGMFSGDPGHILESQLREDYGEWCMDNGAPTTRSGYVVSNLTTIVPKLKRKQVSVYDPHKGRQVRQWAVVGVKLK